MRGNADFVRLYAIPDKIALAKRSRHQWAAVQSVYTRRARAAGYDPDRLLLLLIDGFARCGALAAAGLSNDSAPV
jgi:hypothetical protein